MDIALVLGAGNIWRGKNAQLIGFDPAAADYMGMTATFQMPCSRRLFCAKRHSFDCFKLICS